MLVQAPSSSILLLSTFGFALSFALGALNALNASKAFKAGAYKVRNEEDRNKKADHDVRSKYSPCKNASSFFQ